MSRTRIARGLAAAVCCVALVGSVPAPLQILYVSNRYVWGTTVGAPVRLYGPVSSDVTLQILATRSGDTILSEFNNTLTTEGEWLRAVRLAQDGRTRVIFRRPGAGVIVALDDVLVDDDWTQRRLAIRDPSTGAVRRSIPFDDNRGRGAWRVDGAHVALWRNAAVEIRDAQLRLVRTLDIGNARVVAVGGGHDHIAVVAITPQRSTITWWQRHGSGHHLAGDQRSLRDAVEDPVSGRWFVAAGICAGDTAVIAFDRTGRSLFEERDRLRLPYTLLMAGGDLYVSNDWCSDSGGGDLIRYRSGGSGPGEVVLQSPEIITSLGVR